MYIFGLRTYSFAPQMIFRQATPPECLFLVLALAVLQLKLIFRQATPPECLFFGIRTCRFAIQNNIPAGHSA